LDINELLDKLPDSFIKESDSNLGKFLKLTFDEIDQLQGVAKEVKQSKNITTATNKTLDRHGKNVNQLRGEASDDLYRLQIRSKVRSNLSSGDVNSMIRYISAILQIDRQEIAIEEPDWTSSNYEPASFEVRVPYSSLSNLLVTINQFLDTIDKITAGGVRVALFGQGTFSFASQEGTLDYTPEYDNDPSDGYAGFSDLDQVDGGELGAVYDPEEQVVVI